MEVRRHPRFTINCHVAFLRLGVKGGGNLFNLSVSGCGVESNTNLKVGNDLAVLVHLPDDDPPLEIDQAAVRWSKGREFGLEFIIIRPEERDRLCRYTALLEDRAPQLRRNIMAGASRVDGRPSSATLLLGSLGQRLRSSS